MIYGFFVFFFLILMRVLLNNVITAVVMGWRKLLVHRNTLFPSQNHRTCALEVLVYVMVNRLVVVVVVIIKAALLIGLACLSSGPLLSHLSDFLLIVGFRVVVLAYTRPSLVDREMFGVDSSTVVLGFSTLADVEPSSFLLLEVEAGGVGEEEVGEDDTGETEPGDDVEFLRCADVVVHNGGGKGAKLSDRSCETVGGGTDGGGEDLSGYKEGDRVGAELVEER